MKKYIMIIGLLLVAQLMSAQVPCVLKNLAASFEKGSPQFRAFMSNNENGLNIYRTLDNAGCKYVLTDVNYPKKFSQLKADIQPLIANFTDDKAGSTLCKFLDDCDDPDFLKLMNSDPKYAQAAIGHKTGWVREDYQDFVDEINEIADNTRGVDKLTDWVNRSAKVANFGEVVTLGNSLSRNITTAIKLKSGKLFEDLAHKLGMLPADLANYDILTEVPLETANGFMKADIMLVLRNEDKLIQDVVIIENKLSGNTAFTTRQKECFGSILDGQTKMSVKYKVSGLNADEKIINISKEKIFKMSDSGTDNISNVNINKIVKVN